MRAAADGTPEIFVLGRDRITKLIDVNGDGEADRYESFNADLDVTGRPHAYAMGLETDAAGNFYFLKSGPEETEQGGCLVQVTADGSRMNVVATGFRHPNGVGVSPDGLVTAADNEGNWVPATPLHRIDPAIAVADADDAKYYAGYVPTAHREEAENFDRADPLDAAGRLHQCRRSGVGSARGAGEAVGAAGGGDVAPLVRAVHGEPRADRTARRS